MVIPGVTADTFALLLRLRGGAKMARPHHTDNTNTHTHAQGGRRHGCQDALLGSKVNSLGFTSGPTGQRLTSWSRRERGGRAGGAGGDGAGEGRCEWEGTARGRGLRPAARKRRRRRKKEDKKQQ